MLSIAASCTQKSSNRIFQERIASGYNHNCVLLMDAGIQGVKCWGENYKGELGQDNAVTLGNNPDEINNIAFINLGVNRKPINVFAGGKVSCSILNNNFLKCWGLNSYGQQGQGDTVDRGNVAGDMAALTSIQLGVERTVQFVSVSRAGHHICAILDDDSLKCWGRNHYGQLGVGSTNNQGDDPGEMAILPTVDLGGQTVKFVSAGSIHTCVILNDDSVKCWGQNTAGQLGRNAAQGGGLITDSIGSNNANEITNITPVDLGLGRTAVKIATGSKFNCVIMDNKKVKCWGYNNVGQLGLGHTDNQGDDLGEIATLPTINLGLGAKDITAGSDYACAILTNGKIKCWGQNNKGQLGLGHKDDQGDDLGEIENLPTINLGTGRRALSLSSGDGHNCAYLDNRTIKCWGYNNSGQLGLGHSDDQGDDPNEIENLARVEIF